MYGWYSEKQKSVIQRHFEEKKRKTNTILYVNEKDEVVEVTEVTHSKTYSSKFDDVMYLGPLKKYCDK
jgi:hypothetical protein